jgi:hypothetical protein
MPPPASRRSRAGGTLLTVFAPLATMFGLLLTFATMLSSLNVSVGPDQVAGYAWALGFELIPALGLIAIAAAGRRFSGVRRYVAGLFGALCVAAGLSFTGPMFVSAVTATVHNDQLRQQPVAPAATQYSVADLRALSTAFLADSTSTLDRSHPVVPTTPQTMPCTLGNLDEGTTLSPLGPQQYWTFDNEEAALAAVAARWETAGYDVAVDDHCLGIRGNDDDWLASAEARWIDSAVDYNLEISYETICLAQPLDD